MAQYIDKATLVEEIDKVIDEPAPSHGQQWPWEDGYYCGLYKAESIIDTLEVKEVKINKEISQFIDANFENATIGHKLSLRRVAKHFFELGIKAQKGE